MHKIPFIIAPGRKQTFDMSLEYQYAHAGKVFFKNIRQRFSLTDFKIVREV